MDKVKLQNQYEDCLNRLRSYKELKDRGVEPGEIISGLNSDLTLKKLLEFELDALGEVR